MGQSFETQVLGEYERQKGMFNATTQANVGAVGQQLALNMESARFGMQGRILSALPKPVQMPDYWGQSLSTIGQVTGMGANGAGRMREA